MICLSRKARNASFRGYTAAETAVPCISSAACLGEADAVNFYFAGVARSKSVRPIDDGVGPQTDEFFTLAIGGMCTILNNSGSPVFPGDFLEWCLYNGNNKRAKDQGGTPTAVYNKAGNGPSQPRRVTIRVATTSSERIIGKALTFAKSGETLDMILKAC